MDTIYPSGRFYRRSRVHSIHHPVSNGKEKGGLWALEILDFRH